VDEFLRKDFEGSQIKFKKSVQYDGYVNFDSEKFKNVFYNIAANALAAMPEGGTFLFRCVREDDKLRMDFEDTGIGMGEEVKERVFEDFFSLVTLFPLLYRCCCSPAAQLPRIQPHPRSKYPIRAVFSPPNRTLKSNLTASLISLSQP